jgi:hypothetical protein
VPDDPELISELQTARLVETGPGVVRMMNPRGTHDDLATAVGMAVVHLTDHPTNLTGRFDLAAVRQMTTLGNY